MTKDDVIRMAETQLHRWWLSDEKLERFANLVAAHEREECAKFIESTDLSSLPAQTMRFYALLLKEIGAAIRARGTT